MKFRIAEYKNHAFVIQRRILGMFWIKYKRPKFAYINRIGLWVPDGKACFVRSSLDKAYGVLKDLKDTMTPFIYRGHKILGGPYTFVDKCSKYYDLEYGDDVYAIGETSIYLIKQAIDKAEDNKLAKRIKRKNSKQIVKIHADIYEKDAL